MKQRRRARSKAVEKAVRTILATYGYDERLWSIECKRASSYLPDRNWYYGMTAANSDERDSGLRGGNPYLFIAPLAVGI